jgi:hypothetical protein
MKFTADEVECAVRACVEVLHDLFDTLRRPLYRSEVLWNVRATIRALHPTWASDKVATFSDAILEVIRVYRALKEPKQ